MNKQKRIAKVLTVAVLMIAVGLYAKSTGQLAFDFLPRRYLTGWWSLSTILVVWGGTMVAAGLVKMSEGEEPSKPTFKQKHL